MSVETETINARARRSAAEAVRFWKSRHIAAKTVWHALTGDDQEWMSWKDVERWIAKWEVVHGEDRV